MEDEEIKFTPLRDFESDEFGSTYLKGYSYQARPGNLKLRALLPGWVEEGKVRYGLPDSVGKARVSGKGSVS